MPFETRPEQVKLEEAKPEHNEELQAKFKRALGEAVAERGVCQHVRRATIEGKERLFLIIRSLKTDREAGSVIQRFLVVDEDLAPHVLKMTTRFTTPGPAAFAATVDSSIQTADPKTVGITTEDITLHVERFIDGNLDH